MHDLGLKTSIQTFDAVVRCTLMGNQPWPQFQNRIRERSITPFSVGCISVRVGAWLKGNAMFDETFISLYASEA